MYSALRLFRLLICLLTENELAVNKYFEQSYILEKAEITTMEYLNCKQCLGIKQPNNVELE